MKDMGIVHGSLESSAPVIVGTDTVYVHTDVESVEMMNGEPVNNMYRYHEYQYGITEYIQHIGQENAELVKKNQDLETQTTDTQIAICEIYENLEGKHG